jgi:hypothetical protein
MISVYPGERIIYGKIGKFVYNFRLTLIYNTSRGILYFPIRKIVGNISFKIMKELK